MYSNCNKNFSAYAPSLDIKRNEKITVAFHNKISYKLKVKISETSMNFSRIPKFRDIEKYVLHRSFLHEPQTQNVISIIILLFISKDFVTQLTFTCSKSTTEALEKGVKYVLS